AREVRARARGRRRIDGRRGDARDDRGQGAPRGRRARRGRGRHVSARTPLIAGNWKMHKTEAQAEEYIQALLPRVSAAEGVEIALCVPYTDLRAMVDSAPRSPRGGGGAQNARAGR